MWETKKKKKKEKRKKEKEIEKRIRRLCDLWRIKSVKKKIVQFFKHYYKFFN